MGRRRDAREAFAALRGKETVRLRDRLAVSRSMYHDTSVPMWMVLWAFASAVTGWGWPDV